MDHWKGSLFESLQAVQGLRDFAVDPMASDSEAWKEEDFRLFARLLRITREQIIRHCASLEDRVQYFDEVSHPGDLFLDPDTGVATGKATKRHIKPAEVGRLLAVSPDRLLVIYQHVRAKKVADRVNEVLDVLKAEVRDFSWCSYESGTVAMVFLARTGTRTEQIREHFASILGRHAEGRIRGPSARA